MSTQKIGGRGKERGNKGGGRLHLAENLGRGGGHQLYLWAAVV